MVCSAWAVKEVVAARQEIRDLKTAVDSRYAELAGRVNADHATMRDVLTWRAGLLAELADHFYTKSMSRHRRIRFKILQFRHN